MTPFSTGSVSALGTGTGIGAGSGTGTGTRHGPVRRPRPAGLRSPGPGHVEQAPGRFRGLAPLPRGVRARSVGAMDDRGPDPELRRELDATLQTRRELGPEYESELVDSFLEKIDRRLDSVIERRVRRQTAEQQMAAARGARAPRGGESPEGPGTVFGLAAISLVLAIPLSAIAAVNAGLPGLLVCWAGIFGVNAVHSADRLPWSRAHRERRRRPEDDWES